MKRIKLSLVILIAGLFITKTDFAQNSSEPYEIVKSITLPGDAKWDFCNIDQPTHRLYISRKNKVQVVDLVSETLIGEIDHTTAGVHGIAIASDLNRGFISNGDSSTVSVFDLKTLKIITVVKLKGKSPDAIVYDLSTHRIFAFCAKSNDVSVIDGNTNTIIGSVAFNGNPEFGVTNNKGKIYNNVEDKSELVCFNANTLKVESTWKLTPCEGPTGLAIDIKNNRLFTGCRGNKGLSVINASNGNAIQTLPIGSSVDAVAYDPSTHLIFSSNGDGTLTIIQQDDPDHYKVIQNLITKKGSKTLAYDLSTHKVYLCSADFTPDKKIVTGSFKVLVAAQKNK